MSKKGSDTMEECRHKKTLRGEDEKKLPDLPADQQDTSEHFQSYQRQDSRNPPGMVHQKTQLDLPARGFAQHPLPGKPGYAPQDTIPA